MKYQKLKSIIVRTNNDLRNSVEDANEEIFAILLLGMLISLCCYFCLVPSMLHMLSADPSELNKLLLIWSLQTDEMISEDL